MPAAEPQVPPRCNVPTCDASARWLVTSVDQEPPNVSRLCTWHRIGAQLLHAREGWTCTTEELPAEPAKESKEP